MVTMNVERSQPPHASTTDALLLIVTDYLTGAREHAFVEQLARYVQRDGLVFCRGSGPLPKFVKKGTIRRIGTSHPILSIPYSIDGLSNRDLPRVIEIGGRTAGLAFSLSDTPTSRKSGVNLIAYAIAYHPQGQSHLERSQERKGRAREKIEMPDIPPAVK